MEEGNKKRSASRSGELVKSQGDKLRLGIEMGKEMVTTRLCLKKTSV